MRRTVLATLAVLTAIGMLPTASAQSNTFAVDCNRGQTITQALRQGDFRQPLVINVRGTCREFLNITRANVTLRGTPEAEIMAPDNAHDLVTISADKVTLENLTLTGGLTGLTVNHEPTFIAQEVTVQDTSGVGVRVRVGDARLISCTVQRSGSYGIDEVRGGSVVLSGGSQVMDDVGVGILVDRHGRRGVRDEYAADAALDPAFPEDRPDLARDVDHLASRLCPDGKLSHHCFSGFRLFPAGFLPLPGRRVLSP